MKRSGLVFGALALGLIAIVLWFRGQPTPRPLPVSRPSSPRAAPPRQAAPPPRRLRATAPPTRAAAGAYGATVGIPILMFHRFNPNPRSKTTIAPGEFRRVLSALRDSNYCPISLTDYLSNSFDPACAGRKLFAITFDDGHPSQFRLLPDGSIDPDSGLGVLESVFPKVRATFFLNVSNGGHPFGRDSARKLEILRALKLEIGNHTVSHAYLNRIGASRIAAEVGGTCRYFGMSQMILAYPYGIRPRAPITSYKTGCTITAAFGAWLGYFEGLPRGQSASTGPFLAPLPTSASFGPLRYAIPRLNIHSLADLRRDVLENPGVYTLSAHPEDTLDARKH